MPTREAPLKRRGSGRIEIATVCSCAWRRADDLHAGADVVPVFNPVPPHDCTVPAWRWSQVETAVSGSRPRRQLAARGLRVLIGSRSLEAGAEAARAIGGADVWPVQLDVMSAGDVAACRELIEREVRRLDVLVNNAAIHYDSGQSVLTADLKIVREALDTNLIGAWRLAQMAAVFMRRQRYGRIVNVSSEAGALKEMRAHAPAYRVSNSR